MRIPSHSVSIHPYFKIRPGQREAFLALLPEMIARTRRETGNLYYDFTLQDDVVFCRESYVDANALLVHGANVGDTFAKMLELSDLERVELHGPAAELDKLRGPFADLHPTYFVYHSGVER